jgi:hypothetical protein
MVRVALAVMAALVLAGARGALPHPAVMPPLTFEDQDGKKLALADLRGRVTMIVYGDRSGLEHHLAWGKRLDGDLRARRAYRAHEPRGPSRSWRSRRRAAFPTRFARCSGPSSAGTSRPGTPRGSTGTIA